MTLVFFFSSRRRHTRYIGDWSSDVCSSDLYRREALDSDHAQAAFGVVRLAPITVLDESWFQLRHDSLRSIAQGHRSEERRVGKEGKALWWTSDERKRRV